MVKNCFCRVWKRVRKGEGGRHGGDTSRGRGVKAGLRAQDVGGSEGQDKHLHSHQTGDEWGVEASRVQ